LVLDCFLGSGTTAVCAQSLGRRWIGCDINKGAIQTTAKRLQEVMTVQAAEAAKPQQTELLEDAKPSTPPSQLSFATYRVNDYDLQIQHNEAIELACQHLGITRTRTDAFFDGTQGGRVVKIVPFNHPLTPLDLESVRNELKTRPTEERDVMLVCLGWQHDARAWVDTYNRNRPVNKLHVVELRTDRKLGGIIKHEPISAQITATREGADGAERLVVEVHDVVSPTIMQRLNLEQGVFRAHITDWRAVVDCILIDTQYDGQVFNVAMADVPERKQDLVTGRYELPVPSTGSTVAVKVIDMLGEELVVAIST
jgi:DNA methylase